MGRTACSPSYLLGLIKGCLGKSCVLGAFREVWNGAGVCSLISCLQMTMVLYKWARSNVKKMSVHDSQGTKFRIKFYGFPLTRSLKDSYFFRSFIFKIHTAHQAQLGFPHG
ncbi:hypothetical protein L207DRAFT_127145 [Hyaloscypha variabilis F]|uniref:Uncharacterized protein n=1 Tax=Hyaloscypha variabilis (strain UAMH 11265 / GT02V1 / F) TaxID=1149755 RepID=A0A2J6R8H4_HYAVF|nr:hypothetical protein L207DRAFT_127145 [Hyaloscypha variabilis F]